MFFYSLIAALLVITIVGFWQYKNKQSQPRIIKKIPIEGIDDEANPIIVVFSNNESWLLTEYFPWEICKITEEMLTKDLAQELSVDIVRTDRQCFKIMTNDSEILKKVIMYLYKNK